MGSAWGRIPGPDYRDPAGALAAGQRTPGDLELGARAVALLHERQVFPVARPRGREIAGLLRRAGEPEQAARAIRLLRERRRVRLRRFDGAAQLEQQVAQQLARGQEATGGHWMLLGPVLEVRCGRGQAYRLRGVTHRARKPPGRRETLDSHLSRPIDVRSTRETGGRRASSLLASDRARARGVPGSPQARMRS